MTAVTLPLEVDSLAPMPASVVRLAAMVADPRSGAQEAAQVIELDQALTANVLRWANSAWSASQRVIETVREAVLRLGTARILEFAVGHVVGGLMRKPCEGYGLGEYELWRHSVASALAVERLGSLTTQMVPGTAFTAALLHDFGKLLLNRYLSGDVIHLIAERVETKKITYLEAEREVLGTDHAAVGGAVARHWRFPEPLVLAIENHHSPDTSPDPVLDAVHLANAVAKLVGVGLGREAMNVHVSVEAAGRLGLTSAGLETLCAAVQDDLARTEEIWGITANGSQRTRGG